jgi:hypothetical protein
MKTEVKVAIIGGIVTITVTILTGLFGYLNSRPPAPSPAPASKSVQVNSGDVTNINGDNNIHAGGNVTIQGAQKK